MKADKKNILPGAIAAAFLAAVIVYCVMLNVEKNMLSGYEKGTVLAAKQSIITGTILDEEGISECVTEIQMDKKQIPEAAITDLGQLQGMMAAVEIDSGSVLTSSMMRSRQDITKELLNPVLAGFKAEDLYQVVSGTLRSGDRIHIYTVDEELGNTYLVWENVMVRQVFDNAGSEIPAKDKTTAAHRVNILMDKESIEGFYNELSQGSLRVVKIFDK